MQGLTKENGLLREKLRNLADENHDLRTRAMGGESDSDNKGSLENEVPMPPPRAKLPGEQTGDLDAGKAQNFNEDEYMSDDANIAEDDIFGFASVEEMQAFHERQVMQLAQMHSELIELNEHLQVSIEEPERDRLRVGRRADCGLSRFLCSRLLSRLSIFSPSPR